MLHTIVLVVGIVTYNIRLVEIHELNSVSKVLLKHNWGLKMYSLTEIVFITSRLWFQVQ